MTSSSRDQPADPHGLPGDPADLGDLLQAYLPRLRAFVRSHLAPELRARESTLDLVQSVCRELLEHRDKFSYQGESEFRGWLFTSAVNKVREKIRFHHQALRDVNREATAGNDPLPLAAGSSATPSQAAMAHERIETLEAALDALSAADREVIALSRLAGLPMATVATHLGKTEVAARKQLGRALARLSAELRQRSSARSL